MSVLQYVFVVLPASLIMVWLILAARGPRKIELPNAVAVLRYGGFLRTLTLAVALLLPMIMIYTIAVLPWGRDPRIAHVAARLPWGSDQLLIYAGSAYLAMCLTAGVAFIEVSRGVVCVTEEGVTRVSPWKGRMTLNWTDVESVRYSRLNSVFVVIGNSRKIRVSRYLDGVKAFADTAKRKLATERFRTAISALEAVR